MNECPKELRKQHVNGESEWWPLSSGIFPGKYQEDTRMGEGQWVPKQFVTKKFVLFFSAYNA